MQKPEFEHIRTTMIDDVVLVEILSKNLLGAELAQDLGDELAAVASQDWAKRMLLDFGRTTYLSSTCFGVLVKLVHKAQAKGRQIMFCNMLPEVRIGADILGLAKFAEIHDDQKSALKAFTHD